MTERNQFGLLCFLGGGGLGFLFGGFVWVPYVMNICTETVAEVFIK